VVDPSQIRAAEVVLPCAELDATLEFFTARLGFRIERIWPADDPAVAVIAGHGVRLRLDRGASGPPGSIHLRVHDLGGGGTADGHLRAPNGTTITTGPVETPIDAGPLLPSFVVSRAGDAASWVSGRAGMQYRDLIPARHGGRFIASHIRIDEGGAVPDYVHYHRVRFQMIFCLRGWVRVVYEDQGPPFTLEPGDCVLQPPQIRHRVLESSAGLEVVEISCPAEHETLADHDLDLPTATWRPRRSFGGQTFVRHVARAAPWTPESPRGERAGGFVARDLGIADATGGLAGARVVRTNPAGPAGDADPAAGGGESRRRTVLDSAELAFTFVVAGAGSLRTASHGTHPVGPGDAFAAPPGETYLLDAASADLELLEVTLPAG
jgi:quercetin dioxygenase-like cupin family protein